MEFDIASNTDIFNLVLVSANNLQCIVVCKKWTQIILQECAICSTCNKITKIYTTDIWSTDDNDVTCHLSG